MTSKDELGDRMKLYENTETSRKFDSALPVYARIDGRGFSKFTNRMERPFDARMTRCMIEVTKYLVEKTHASIGYCQSDEISLVWPDSTIDNKLFFAGKIQKMCSVLASMSAAKFAVELQSNFGMLGTACPHFDCRVIQLPNRTEAANMLLWRSLDARKNSVSMAARHYFSHSKLQNKRSKDMIEMMAEIGVTMDQLPASFTHGTWVQRVVEERVLTTEELANIPENHRPGPTELVKRSKVLELDMPPFVEVKNRIEVIFDSATPII